MAKKEGKLTPMMEQYQRIRRELPEDVLLMFRLGDFYELFFDDAKQASPLLNVALTKRNGIPMCGVPHHAAEGYMTKLIKGGRRVAIAEQTSEPQPGKIVEREVRQIISAGSIDNLSLLDASTANYLAAVYFAKGAYGFACVEHTTGEFRVAEFQDRADLEDELVRLRPSEVLYSDDQAADFDLLSRAQEYDSYAFLYDQAVYQLQEHFRVTSLDGFGCQGLHAGIAAAGGIIHYLTHQLRRSVDHIKGLDVFSTEEFVLIDGSSQVNLDLLTSRSAGVKGALIGAVDRTNSPMGGRLLKDWILHPLRELAPLQRRQECVKLLTEQPFLLSEIQQSFAEVRDIERTLSRLSLGSGNARDMQTLGLSLGRVPGIATHLQAMGSLALVEKWKTGLGDFSELVELLARALTEEPPAGLKEGGIFRDGFSDELDTLRQASTEGRQWIAELQQQEQERTGITSLKIKYNAVFGYFIEITKTNLDRVPEEYVRKQTMANAERFITPQLKEMENKILGADERLKTLEYEEFLNLRETVLEHIDAIQETARTLAEIDVITSFAETARLFDYCQPRLEESKTLQIVNGRHPVLDQNIGEEKFVPNSTDLLAPGHSFTLLTGPNMAGKSTYIRQVALITLLAQIGSFVPAESATIGLVDRIFTRVGASDDLAKGQSTFMVEMTETALICNNATEKSLVILDEIGRGTATYDGLSIAWSVAEHLYDQVKCRALFATHYHELTQLADAREGIQNYSVAVREWNDQIIFLRQIIPGAADRSYGIQVARLAGLPQSIIDRASVLLKNLEGQNTDPESDDAKPKAAAKKAKKRDAPVEVVEEPAPAEDDPQMTLF